MTPYLVVLVFSRLLADNNTASNASLHPPADLAIPSNILRT